MTAVVDGVRHWFEGSSRVLPGLALSLVSAGFLGLGLAKAPAPLIRSDAVELERLLDKAGLLTDRYQSLFKDLTAEETRSVEIFDKQERLSQTRRTVSDLIVYESHHDPKRVLEYRNIREVDGRPIKKQSERVEKLFERLARSDSTSQEVDRITRESARYDFGYEVTGYTILHGMALWKQLRRFFKYGLQGYERVGDRDVAVVAFDQTEFLKDLFGLLHYGKLDVTGPLMRGQYRLDKETALLWREHHEIFYRDNKQARTFKAIEMDYDHTPGENGIWVPKRVVFQYFKPLKYDRTFPLEMYRAARITSDLGPFRRFDVKARQEGH